MGFWPETVDCELQKGAAPGFQPRQPLSISGYDRCQWVLAVGLGYLIDAMGRISLLLL
jgi:hypothetical protein